MLKDIKTLAVPTSENRPKRNMRPVRFPGVVCKHVKSNAIVYGRPGQIVGIGAGQMSRVDSVKLAGHEGPVDGEGLCHGVRCVLSRSATVSMRRRKQGLLVSFSQAVRSVMPR